MSPEGSGMQFGDIALVVVGAGLGGGVRYVLGTWLTGKWGAAFPWHTFLINITGSFLLGVVMALSVERGLLSSPWRLFLGTGILGGYTTFSTLSYESVALMGQGLWMSGALNMFGSGLAGLIAALLGLVVGRLV